MTETSSIDQIEDVLALILLLSTTECELQVFRCKGSEHVGLRSTEVSSYPDAIRSSLTVIIRSRRADSDSPGRASHTALDSGGISR